jgi:hypothetical protein
VVEHFKWKNVNSAPGKPAVSSEINKLVWWAGGLEKRKEQKCLCG